MSLLNFAYVDLETRKVSGDFSDGWGPEIRLPCTEGCEQLTARANVLKMGFGLAGVFDNRGMRFFEDPMDLLMYLLDDAVDGIVTFNGECFDFPALLGSLEPEMGSTLNETFLDGYNQLTAKSVDLLRIVTKTLGHRLKLDQITSVLLNHSKEFDGALWWKYYNDPTKRVQALNYLLGDVVYLYQIYGIAFEAGELAYRDNLGQTRKFSIKVPSFRK